MLDRAKFSVGSIYFLCKKKIVDPTMDPTGIFLKLYVIASPQAECQARVNVNATHGTKTRVAYVSLHLMGSSRSIYPAGITIGIKHVNKCAHCWKKTSVGVRVFGLNKLF